MSEFPTDEELKSAEFEHGRRIVSGLKGFFGNQRWGFVICRITYSDQSKWEEFLADLKNQTQEDIADSKYAHIIARHLEWTVLEDKERLNGVTMSEASQYFRQWVADQGYVEADFESPLGPWIQVDPRYHSFIYGCTETIDSMLNPARNKFGRNGNFFHLVNATVYAENEEYERVHSVRVDDNAWIRVSADCYMTMYDELMNPNNWEYQRSFGMKIMPYGF